MRRWILFAALVGLAGCYAGALLVFVSRSHDFVVARINAEAQQRAATLALPWPSLLTFAPDGNGLPLLGAGWYPAQPEGTWSSRQRAWVYLPPPPSTNGSTLTIHGRVLVASDARPVTVTIAAAGAELGRWQVAASQPDLTAEVALPGGLPAGPIKLRIDVSALVSPRRLTGQGADRPQGFRLETIELRQSP